MVAVGSSSRLPSTIWYSSRPSNTAPRASIESGSRQLRGLVARGLKRMITCLPRQHRFGNATVLDGDVAERSAGVESTAVHRTASGLATAGQTGIPSHAIA